MNTPKPSFFAELQRRNVYKVGAMYAVVGWLVVQVVTQVFPVFEISALVQRVIVLAIIAGFPVALVLSWIYELTPQGIVKTDEVAPDSSITRNTGQQLNRAIIAGLSLAVIVLLAKVFWPRMPGAADASSGAAAAKNPPSVAVLPLSNESGDKDQQYFSDGLTEDLITALSQSSGLKVISRSSSFQFRESHQDARTIGAALGVAHLVEGSVRRVGEVVRISAELVAVADGSTLWSQHYDRPYADLFALQDEIAAAVATALKTHLMPASGAVDQSDRPPSGSLDAYNAYLQGVFYSSRFNEKDQPTAIGWFEKAVALDPQYARAYVALGAAWLETSGNFAQGADAEAAHAKGRQFLDQALALQPDLATAHARLAQDLGIHFDWTGAEVEARRALSLAPTDAFVQRVFAITLAAKGRVGEAYDRLLAARSQDPLSARLDFWLTCLAMGLGRYDDAERFARHSIELQPTAGLTRYYLVMVQLLRGDPAAAQLTASQTPDNQWRTLIDALVLQAAPDRAAADAALQKLIDKQAGNSAYQIAEIYAFRQQPDAMFAWLDRAVENRDPGLELLICDPTLLRYRDDPRFAALRAKLHLVPLADSN